MVIALYIDNRYHVPSKVVVVGLHYNKKTAAPHDERQTNEILEVYRRRFIRAKLSYCSRRVYGRER